MSTPGFKRLGGTTGERVRRPLGGSDFGMAWVSNVERLLGLADSTPSKTKLLVSILISIGAVVVETSDILLKRN
jgi:hypothetical protein